MAKNQVVVSITSNTKGLQQGLSESNSLLGKLGSVAGGALKAVAAVGVGLAVVAAAGGVARALKLDDANTKLKALHYNTEQMEKITQSALKSVKGTAFGLDSAVNSAVGLLAAGIKPGQDLTRVLTTISNTAALAGVSMDEMGSIFNKVAANGKVTTMEMNQLADRGVPIWQYLSSSLGVSNSELRKMIEAGTVTSAMFNDALGPAVEGVATTMGTSFKGMLANAKAALSRLGAMFAAPALSWSKGVLGEFTAMTDGLSSILKPVSTRWDEWLQGISFEGVGKRFSQAFEGVSLADGFQVLVNLAVDWISNDGVTAMAAGMLSFRDTLSTGIYSLVDAIARNTPAIVVAITDMVVGFISGLAEMSPYLTDAGLAMIMALVNGLVNSIPQLISSLDGLLPELVSAVTQMAPAILVAGLDMFMALVKAIPQVIPPLIKSVVDLLPKLIKTIVDMVPQLLTGAVQLFSALIDAVIQIVPVLLAAVITLLPVILTAIMGMIPQVITAAIDLFLAIVKALPVIIPMLIQAVVELLPILLEAIFNMVPALWEGAIQLFVALVEAIPVIIPLLIKAIFDLLPVLITTVIGLVPQLLLAGIQLFVALVKAIPEIIPALAKTVNDLGPTIFQALLKMIPELISAGNNMMGGLIDGLWKSAGKLGAALLKIAQDAIGGFLSFLGIKSPSKLFQGFGDNLGQGLAIGIDKSGRAVSKALDGMSSLVADGFNASMSAPELSLAVGAGSGAGTAQVVNNYRVEVNTLNATAETGRVIIQSIKDYENAGGRL